MEPANTTHHNRLPLPRHTPDNPLRPRLSHRTLGRLTQRGRGQLRSDIRSESTRERLLGDDQPTRGHLGRCHHRHVVLGGYRLVGQEGTVSGDHHMLGRPQVLKYVFSSTLSPTDPEVKVGSGDAVEFVRGLKGQPGAGIWLCGGAGLAGQLLGEIDELVVKRYPVVFGSGIPLFRAPFAPADWQLCGSRVFLTGTTLTSYVRRQEH
ncbi:dihydrofolate reductase family protein [Streptomyces noursei]|uniref:dihydrofolate reductase family protein n=1 Tax=Streptomyces noursei TaxID=1971 RepID=UPI0037A5E7C7